MFRKRQLDACLDWKAFGEDLSGSEIPDFDIEQYQEEYVKADEDSKDDTFLGRSFLAALAIFAGVFGFVLKKTDTVSYIYGEGLVYSGIMRIISAFRRTEIVYIQ